ncbi:MAG: cytochrome c assembly protein [Verrucomicrobia bacterium]|nr:MAG: cytochrome c assembly protein [Verrucomicrobiota bacterium]
MVHSVFVWRKGFRQDSRVTYLLLLAGFGLHTTAMLMRGSVRQRCPISNLYEATTFVLWTIVAVYLVIGLWSRVRFFGAFASPILFAIGVFALMPSLDPPSSAKNQFPPIWTSLHATLPLLAYAAFALSSVAAVMYLTQERNLKMRKLQAIFSLMPPIQRLETVIERTLLSGFILLTAGLVLGAFTLAHAANPQAYRGDPKILWSVLVWFLYLGLILMRWRFAQAGRRFALGAIGSFVFVLLTFWGTNALSQLHHP